MTRPLFGIQDLGRLTRRSFILAAGSLAAAVSSSCSNKSAVRNPNLTDYPFKLGVASGDPTPDGVVLWTRLAPDPLNGGGMPADPVEVEWQIAEDEQMTRVVDEGVITAEPEWAHAVHVAVEGLRPDRWYWYWFKVGNEVSPKGRTRTMPPEDALPGELRFAFVSCQNYEFGYFTAYQHMREEDLDLVLHLGDYIYESGATIGLARRHVGNELNTLADYRNRYAQYKTDPDLQAMHAAVPWIVTWDDHELDDNYAGAVSKDPEVSTRLLLHRRAAAYRAYYEHMPLRPRSLPDGPNLLLYRRIAFGRLAEFFVLDTRQYRTDQPCGDGQRAPCQEVYEPHATLLGTAQRDWLLYGLGVSEARWNVLTQQVMMARVDRTPGPGVTYSMDQWPGYESERRELLTFLHTQNISNPVVLAGDIHSNWASELILDFDRFDSPSAATEFVGTSISSGGDGAANPDYLGKLLEDNPFLKFHNNERGYVFCRVTPKTWRSDYRTVPYVSRPGAPLNTRASFVVRDGLPKLNKA